MSNGFLTDAFPSLAHLPPCAVIGVTAYFYFYEATRMAFAGDKPISSLSFFQVLISGGMGGVGYWALCYPADIVKSAVQCDAIDPAQRKYKGALGG